MELLARHCRSFADFRRNFLPQRRPVAARRSEFISTCSRWLLLDFLSSPGARIVHMPPSNQLKNLNSRSNPSWGRRKIGGLTYCFRLALQFESVQPIVGPTNERSDRPKAFSFLFNGLIDHSIILAYFYLARYCAAVPKCPCSTPPRQSVLATPNYASSSNLK